MGYESKVYFCRDYGYPKGKLHHSEIVAMMDMSKMGYEATKFWKMFDKETPFSLYIQDYDEEKDIECMMDVTEDKYGDRICYCDNINALIRELDKLIKLNLEQYNLDWTRGRQLKAMLKAFKDEPEIYVVHYGY